MPSRLCGGLDFPRGFTYYCLLRISMIYKISILADRFLIGNERANTCCSSPSRRASQTASHGVHHAQIFGVGDREAETREIHSSRSQSRLEITPFHPYLRGERVECGRVEYCLAPLRDEYIPEVQGSATDA